VSRTVLVTGVSRHLGGRAVALLAAHRGWTVIGVDVVAPPTALEGVTFVRADIRSPVIARIMGEAEVDTVVHMGVIATPRQAGSRSAMKEINVIGTMQLLAACQRTPAVRHVVVKSTAAVYGSGANILGPRMRTGLTGYFSLPVVPTVLGFDPRLQFVHEDDAISAIEAAVDHATSGTFNIAGWGVLLLSQALRMARRTSVAVPARLVPVVGSALGARGQADLSPEAVRYLTYGRALDTSAAQRTLGFHAHYSSTQAFASFARTLTDQPVPDGSEVGVA